MKEAVPVNLVLDWTTIPLGEIGRIVTGSTPPTARKELYGGTFPFIKPTQLQNSLVSSGEATLTDEGAKVADVVPHGSILVSCIGSLGRVGLATQDVAFNQQINAIVPKDPALSKWIFYALQTSEFINQLNAVSSATTIAIVNKGKFSKLTIRVAPPSLRNIIIEDVETQLSRLEAGVSALKRAQANLKRYRAAILKAACEGRLVPTEAELARAEGRDYETGTQLIARIDKDKDYRGRTLRRNTNLEPDAVNDIEGWGTSTVDRLTAPDRKSAYGVLLPGDHKEQGVPLIRVGDIGNGQVDTSHLKKIDQKIDTQYPRTKLKGGELLITLVGAIGRTAIVPASLAGANVARAVGVVPLTTEVEASWIEIWFRNPDKVVEMENRSHEVARKTLNLEDVRAAHVAVPPIVEQRRIVVEVERLLSVVDELEATLAANLRRAARLRQSVLQQAFSPSR